MGIILLSIEFYKQRDREKLKVSGIKIQGIVTKIKRVSYPRVGSKSRARRKYPYIICFSYEYSGQKYDGKSKLLWYKPIIFEGDIITLWIDEYKKHHYFVEV